MGKNKIKKWKKFRHKIIFAILRPFVRLYSKIKFNVKIERFDGDKKRNYFIFYNHQTSGDQFFIASILKKPIYFVATEDIFSTRFLSRFLRWFLAPIPINKTAIDLNSIKTCIRVAKEGGNICIAPEGNRTYSGKTCFIKPSIVKLIRALKIPVMMVKIEGGYGVQPRWTDKNRKGYMSAKVFKVIEYDEYSKMTDEELYKVVKECMYVDDFAIDKIYRSNKKAEYLERLIYTCPRCGISEWQSAFNDVTCKKCGLKVSYSENKTLTANVNDFPFKNVSEWYEWQNNFISNLDISTKTLIFKDKVKIFEVILKKGKNLISKSVDVEGYVDKIVLKYDDKIDQIDFVDVQGVAVLGRNKLNVKYMNKTIQFKGDKRFNAIKYMNLYYKSKNVVGEGENGIFLGL